MYHTHMGIKMSSLSIVLWTENRIKLCIIMIFSFAQAINKLQASLNRRTLVFKLNIFFLLNHLLFKSMYVDTGYLIVSADKSGSTEIRWTNRSRFDSRSWSGQSNRIAFSAFAIIFNQRPACYYITRSPHWMHNGKMPTEPYCNRRNRSSLTRRRVRSNWPKNRR
jgi:hypothetical protein